MRLTTGQYLALAKPYTEAEAVERAEEGGGGVGPHHISVHWITSELQVMKVFTVSIPAEARPFWHVSMSLHVRDVGVIYTRGMEKSMRRKLRDIGQDVLKDVGYPPDEDKWDIEEKALHLMRCLTDGEIAYMEECRG